MGASLNRCKMMEGPSRRFLKHLAQWHIKLERVLLYHYFKTSHFGVKKAVLTRAFGGGMGQCGGWDFSTCWSKRSTLLHQNSQWNKNQQLRTDEHRSELMLGSVGKKTVCSFLFSSYLQSSRKRSFTYLRSFSFRTLPIKCSHLSKVQYH